MKRLLLLILCATLLAPDFSGQESDTARRSTFLPLPVVFRLPETNWAFGAAMLYAFYLDEQEKTPPSQIQLGGAYTLNNQLLLYLPFQLFGSEDAWRAKGELGYYRYSYFFFGVGNSLQNSEGELYHVDFPRLRIDGMKPLGNGMYAGLRYWLENYKVDQNRFEEGGYFSQGIIAGSRGGVISGTGPVFVYDTRDHVMRPHSGVFAEASYQHFSGNLGSAYLFDRYRLDVRGYKTLWDKHVIAGQLWLDHNTGNVPFSQMSLLGGSRRMRGFYEGRYRDRNAIVFQGEFRPDIYKRWGAALFANAGVVANSPSTLSIAHLRTTYGAGIRYELNAENRLNLRFDVAVGNGQLQTYFTFGEAF